MTLWSIAGRKLASSIALYLTKHGEWFPSTRLRVNAPPDRVVPIQDETSAPCKLPKRFTRAFGRIRSRCNGETAAAARLPAFWAVQEPDYVTL